MLSHDLANRAAATNMLSQTPLARPSSTLWGMWARPLLYTLGHVTRPPPAYSSQSTAPTLFRVWHTPPWSCCPWYGATTTPSPPPRTKAGGPAATEAPTPHHGFTRCATLSATMSTTHPWWFGNHWSMVQSTSYYCRRSQPWKAHSACTLLSRTC